MNPADQARLELLEEFKTSTRERVEKITHGWIALEKNPADAATAEELPRELHSLKGEAKMMGFADVSLVAHRTEELVLVAQARSFKVDDDFGDLVIAAADVILQLVQKKAGTQQATVDLSAMLARFDRCIARVGGITPHQGPAATIAEPAPTTWTAPVEQRMAPDAFLRVNADDVAVFSESASEVLIAHTRYEFGLRRLRAVEEATEVALGQMTQAEEDAGVNATQGLLARDSSGAALAALRRFHGELRAIAQSMGQEIYEGQLRARELDHRAQKLRLVPVQALLGRYVRAIRDIAREHDKPVSVDISDSGVTLDKNVVDRLADPLLHLVRNSIDHGIESREVRARAGKGEEGHIVLAATYEGGQVLVTVSDDGGGINTEIVRAKATAAGLVTPEVGATLSEEDCMNLLFRSGFSTRSEATEVSGRGVGLDVVKRNIEALGGTVRVSSQLGRGTRFELRVPISIALTRVLVIEVDGELFALPAAAVESVLVIDPAQVQSIHDRKALRFRDRWVPIMDLGGLLESTGGEVSPRAVVVRHEDSWVAARISQWHTDVEVVLKPLGVLLSSARVAVGACTLQDGRVAVTLNPAEIVARGLGAAPRIARAASSAAVRTAGTAKKRVLLTEDSAITRGMVAGILRTLGYEVLEAEDGRAALVVLAVEKVDLLLTDIDMPNMNGIELIREVRAQRHLENLPIVVLSTRGTDADRRRALEAGADAHLVKTEFSEDALRDVITQRLGGR